MAVILGIDVGSTTAKIVVVKNGEVKYERYERHFSQVRQKTLELVQGAADFLRGEEIFSAISGSAGMGEAHAAGIPFVQEVFATGEAVRRFAPQTDVVVELGGEDAKIIFFRGGMDERMNGSCAGGTGAFIDQMATLLSVTPAELDELSLNSERIYPIASRCGVFAKSDLQPLLNQGARKEDIAASIYQAVVNQTITGLAQGRRIEGNVMFLGGPLYYCKGLRCRFVKTLGLDEAHALFPEYGRFAVALGAAIYAEKARQAMTYDELVAGLTRSIREKTAARTVAPLFENQEEYDEFCARHAKASVPAVAPDTYSGDAYLGIDCGSTTTKLCLISADGRLLDSFYSSNHGEPVEIVLEQLIRIRRLCGDRIRIRSSAVTGYGEELIRAAFHLDGGLVETMAHFRAARHFNPDVEFILDIGGQDIKCFRVRNESIDSIMLNEACSSGCGSFLETFAKALGYTAEEFAKLGLFAKHPVDLGSRCTVFMNSSVKQAQKDGADVSDISAGLSMSVVRNALYKVIRATSADELGREIVVQGGTFLNDAVLRSFEREIGRNVVRPAIAGLMGAFGAALYAATVPTEQSTLLSLDELERFTHTAKAVTCKGCTNRCPLTVNTFRDSERLISGNKCEKGAGSVLKSSLPNLYEFKQKRLNSLKPIPGPRGTLGLPQALGMIELAPFWYTIFTELGFTVRLSGDSSRALYAKGQYTIPSDTVCYPAKLMHGHIQTLLEQQVDAIFYPCLTYNFDERESDNHYNCPVVAYYSELLHANDEDLQKTRFLYPYLNINNEKQLTRELFRMLQNEFGGFTQKQVRAAVRAGYEKYGEWQAEIVQRGREALDYASRNQKRVIVLAGRPYHVDPEINHGIDKLIASLGLVVVTEDSVSPLAHTPKVGVLNQWTYHSRLYRAAEFVAEHENCELVQLVSFGCGVDAITTDEVRAILEKHGRLYTQIKIDEITNLGAVKIRVRSLLEALEERRVPNG